MVDKWNERVGRCLHCLSVVCFLKLPVKFVIFIDKILEDIVLECPLFSSSVFETLLEVVSQLVGGAEAEVSGGGRLSEKR